MPETSYCVLCPDRGRIPDRPPVCESCRLWVAAMIEDVRLYAIELAAPADLVPDLRTVPVPFGPRLREWHDLDKDATVRRRDYLTALLPSASSGARAGAGPVSGSRDAPVPISVDRVDILMPPRQGSVPATVVQATVADAVTVNHRYVRIVAGEPVYVCDEVTGVRRLRLRDPYGFPLYLDAHDQVGYLPLVSALDSWVRAWRDIRNAGQRGEGLPDAHIDGMCRWLSSRVGWACDDFEPIPDFADEIRAYRSAMAGILGLVEKVDYKDGVACPQCGVRALYQPNGGVRDGTLWIECGNCPAIMTPDEFVGHAAAQQSDAVKTTVAMMTVSMATAAKAT